MNFAEYIAVLSGDTSMLEKAKLDKEILSLESLRAAHYKEIARTRGTLDRLVKENELDQKTLILLENDTMQYRAQLKHDKDGIKENSIHLIGIKSSDPEIFGNHIIDLYKHWRPANGQSGAQRIGSLYGFDLYIEKKQSLHISGERDSATELYACRTDSGIKYNYNQGAPNIDNAKLAARYFLNAIDRCENIAEQYRTRISKNDKEIKLLTSISEKTFEKQQLLDQKKAEVSQLEKTITETIQARQLAVHGSAHKEVLNEDSIPTTEIKTSTPTKVLSLIKPPVTQHKRMGL
ncbi:hypothetical protein D3C73_462160 [compost metagenome]